MPLSVVEHGHQATSGFLWGLLPDNPDVVARWAKLSSVSRNDVVGMLAHLGEDCAGAVQLVPPERVERVLGAPTPADETTSVDWLTEKDAPDLLAALRKNPAAGRTSAEQGQFSLAGAQPKTALYQNDQGRWGVPRGRVPTNRILKPPVLDLEDLAYNEHFCVARFLDANVLNWLLAGSDAHAKNYSLLLAAGPELRLAPLYDVITVLPYPKLVRGGARLAMAVDNERVVDRITGKHWRALARSLRLPADLVIDRIFDLGGRIPAAIDRIMADPGVDKKTRTVFARLVEPVTEHVRACLLRIA
jgi:serine/threonine protein kinase HipA of HipAB toxin-antitoxin module